MPEIEGILEEVVFRNEQSSWTVLSVRVGRNRVTAVGELPPCAAGERVKLEGEWAEHRDYGRQLRVTKMESVRPTTLSGIEKYLGSGLLKGVGPATAKMIVQEFGRHTLTVLDDAPERLREISGIGPKRAHMIAESYREHRETRMTMVFLQTYGLSPTLSARIIKAFGEDTQEIVKRDPYLLAERVEGIGFKTADAIAYSLGVEKESEHRLTCGVLFTLEEAVRVSGHTYLPKTLLVERAKALMQVEDELIDRAIAQLTLDMLVIARETHNEIRVYLRRLYEAEGEVAMRLTRLLRPVDAISDIDRTIRDYERESGVTLCDEQRQALNACANGAVMILTGGPGTGKTTCLHCMLRVLGKLGAGELCAPTGRAAKRMSEATGAPARTIHRLLEYSGGEDRFQRDEDHPLNAKYVIVDEMSMTDIFLMRALLRALKGGTRLIMVGDRDQLPSVGAGNVLGDMIASGRIPTVRLINVFRQAQQSQIVMNAHRIHQGVDPIMNGKDSDFFFERADTAQQAADAIVRLVTTRLPKYLGVSPIQIQVMAPMKKGEAGVWALNQRLQKAINPPDVHKSEIHTGETLLREGDKVMQVRNNYDLEWTREGESGVGVFNGDMGVVTSIDTQEGSLRVLFDDERQACYMEEDLPDLETAYCISVHKSQGGEYDAIVLSTVAGPRMLCTRNLLYTAVTRAKRLAILVGRSECVREMVQNDYVSKRYSALAQRLMEG